MNWKPIRKVLAQIYLAIIGNGAVAGVIAGTNADWKGLLGTVGASVLLIGAGYLTTGEKVAPPPPPTPAPPLHAGEGA